MKSPLAVDCTCHDCGKNWESPAFAGKCIECGSDNISQVTIIKDKNLLTKWLTR